MAVPHAPPPVCHEVGCDVLAWRHGACTVHARICQVVGCHRKHEARGLCNAHYKARTRRLRREENLATAAAIADAVLWSEAVVSEAVLALEVGR